MEKEKRPFDPKYDWPHRTKADHIIGLSVGFAVILFPIVFGLIFF